MNFELFLLNFSNIFCPFESIESQIFESNRTNFKRIPIWLHPYAKHDCDYLKVADNSWKTFFELRVHYRDGVKLEFVWNSFNLIQKFEIRLIRKGIKRTQFPVKTTLSFGLIAKLPLNAMQGFCVKHLMKEV